MPPPLPPSLNHPIKPLILTLKQFIQRQQVLSLYRAILRVATSLPPPPKPPNRLVDARREIREHARAEFERNRACADEGKIRFLIAMGREDLRRLREGVQ